MEEAEDHATQASCAMEARSDGDTDNAREAQRVVLRTIVIDNFKNYIGQHTLDVDGQNFVCFFGRNGAGKSCVVDAIAFCLGASPQQLRVKRFANLVNDVVATSTTEAIASVVLRFDIADSPKEKRLLWVKRVIEAATSQSRYFYRDSESSNWTGTSKNALASNLRRFGVDMQLQDRFIIRQANATGLAQMSSLQLLHFCERIIGTFDLKEQLVQINLQWNERSSGAEKLREQIRAKESEAIQCQPMVCKFQDWAEKTQKIKTAQQEAKLFLINVEQKMLRSHRTEAVRVQTEIKHQRSKAADLQNELERKDSERARHVDMIEGHHKLVSEAIQHLKQTMRAKTKCSSALQTMRAESSTIQTRLAHFKREQSDSEALASELNAETIANSTALTEKQSLLIDLEEAIVAKRTESSEPKTREHEIQELVLKIERLVAEQRDAVLKQETQARKKRDTRRAVATIEKDLENCLQKKTELEASLLTLEESVGRELLTAAEQTAAQVGSKSQVEKLESDLELQIRKMSKTVSRSRGDEAIYQLQNSLGKEMVLGRLWELASTDSMYATAVNSALRAQLPFVVVQDRRAAVSIARVFADKAIGRISCCVLEDFDHDVRCDASTCGLSREDHEYGNNPIPLCQVLKCVSETARRVFHKFGHNWMICHDADQATKLSSNGAKNFVTLQGDLFFSDGSIRACRFEDESKLHNGPRIRLCDTHPKSCKSADIGEYDELIASLSGQLKESRASRDEAQRKLKELDKRIHTSRLEILGVKEQLKEVCTTVETLEVNLEQARQSLQRQDTLPSNLVFEESHQWEAQVAELKKRKARLTKSRGDKERAELLTKQAQVLKEIETLKEREALNKTHISKLQGKGRAIALQLETLEEKSESVTSEENRLQDLLETVQQQVDAGIEKVDKEKASLALSKSKLEEFEAELRSLTSQRREVRHTIERLIKKEDNIMGEIASLEKEIGDIGLQTSEQDDPMEGDLLDQLEDLRAKARQEIHNQEEEQRVQELVKSCISVETVEQAINCEQELVALQAELDLNLLEMTTLGSRQHDLSTTRHERLVDSLRVVNENFSRIYRLMNEDGDCYLGYSLERTTLFLEGITLNCKPDESHWQPFVGLSGGQQVVCAVSLMLALQASFPSPFYVCDEIDAALDTVNVRKLAELLRDQSCQSSTQFLVVSHRPEMWEISKYLIGVYECERSAQIVSCRFE